MFATHHQTVGAPAPMNFTAVGNNNNSYDYFSAHASDAAKTTTNTMQPMNLNDPAAIAAAAALYMPQYQQQQQQLQGQQQPTAAQQQSALQLLQQNAMFMASNPMAMAAAAAALQQHQQLPPHQQQQLAALLASQLAPQAPQQQQQQHYGGNNIHSKTPAAAAPGNTLMQNYLQQQQQQPQQQQLSLASLASYGGMQHQLQSMPAAPSQYGHFAPQPLQYNTSILPTPQPQHFQYQQPQPQQQQQLQTLMQQHQHQQQQQQHTGRVGAAPPPYNSNAPQRQHNNGRNNNNNGPAHHTLTVSSASVAPAASSLTGASVPAPGTMGPANCTVALAAYAEPMSRLRRVAASVDHLGDASDEFHGRATLYEDYRTVDSVPVEGAPPGRPTWKRQVNFVQVVVAQVSGPACREPAAVMDLLAQALLRCGGTMLRREDIWFLDTPRVNFKDGRTTGLMSVKVSPAAARVLLFLSRDSVSEPTPHTAAAHDLPIETASDAPHIVAMRGGENSGGGVGAMPLSLAIAHPRPRILFVSGFSVLLSLTPAGVEQLLTLETHHQARQQQHLPRSGVTFALPWRLCVQRYQSINAYVLPPLDPATGLPVAPVPAATTAAVVTAAAAAAAITLATPPMVVESGLTFKADQPHLVASAPSMLSMPREGDSPHTSASSNNNFS